MKRALTLGILPVILGIVAAVLRAYELAFVFNPVTGLPSNPMAVTPILNILVIATAVFFAVMAYFAKPDKRSCRGHALPIAGGVTFVILFALSGYQLYMCLSDFVATNLIYGILTLLCSVSALVLSLKGLEMRESNLYNVLAAIPAFWACYAVILIFRQRISQPIISDYIYLLLALLCILLFAYCQCGYVFGKGRIRLAAFIAPFGTFLCTIELIAPVIAAVLKPAGNFMQVNLSEIAPLAAFLVYMPVAVCCILKGANVIQND